MHTDSMERTDVAKELGHFLRTRRERLGPDSEPGVRRTRGLRREEVAEKAAVSREYYTKLEQGRALNPSSEVLEAVAAALLLSSDEVMYVQDLAALLRGGSPRKTPTMRPTGSVRGSSALSRTAPHSWSTNDWTSSRGTT